jgi:hypothetical protein
MKKCLVALVVILLKYSSAQAEVQVYTALVGGSTTMKETQVGASYNHESQFFVGHLGGAFGGGYVFTTNVIGVGFKGELAWVGNTVDRKNSASSDKSSYRFESQRLLSGVTLSLRPGPVAIDFEYYPWIQNMVSYSDQKSQNPFRKGDDLKGTGYGVGFAFKFFPPMRNFIMFRKLSYKNVEMDGVSKTLPNENFDLLKFDEVLIGFGSEF